MTTKVITGEERIIYYHHEIAVMAAAALLLWLLHQPILPYLDVAILCIGVFLVCGRIGCLLVGCCHGRPYRWGIRYRKEHVDVGFTPYYVGVRLFPIQAVESLWVFGIVATGVGMMWRGAQPGTTLAWYVVMYDLGRFCFEFLRGDAERPYWCGFSQPQWISLVLMIVVVWAEFAGLLPLHGWHVVATAGLAAAMIFITANRRWRRTDKYRLLHPRHVQEVAAAMEWIATPSNPTPQTGKTTTPGQWTLWPKQQADPSEIRVGCTSLGVQISTGVVRDRGAQVQHYALSCRDGEMTEETARLLSKLILQLKRATSDSEFVKAPQNVFHLLIPLDEEKELVG